MSHWGFYKIPMRHLIIYTILAFSVAISAVFCNFARFFASVRVSGLMLY